MALTWDEVAAKPEFKALSYDDQLLARQQYFTDVVLPQVDAKDRQAAFLQFNSFADSLEPPPVPVVAPAPKDTSDVSRGFKTAFEQLPQLGYGLLAAAGATAENAFGEGGIATGVKNAGVRGYQEWSDKIATTSKKSDSLTYSYEQAQDGNFGALVDWLQYGFGYAGGQGLQMLVTAGVGSVLGKAGLKAATSEIASGLVAKEAARIAGTKEGAALAAEQLNKIAVANVASKVGQTAAIGAQAFGMEGGEIGGDLVSSAEKSGRKLTGDDLARAFGATIAAGSLEFVGDKLGLDLMLGKSKLLSPAAGMKGVGGMAARGAIAGTAAMPIEAGTEYGQTLFEEYGKGNDPWSEASRKQAIDAAGLGAIGGMAMGGVGGVVSSPRRDGAKRDTTADPVNDIDPAVDVDDAIRRFESTLNMDNLGDIHAEMTDFLNSVQPQTNPLDLMPGRNQAQINAMVNAEADAARQAQIDAIAAQGGFEPTEATAAPEIAATTPETREQRIADERARMEQMRAAPETPVAQPSGKWDAVDSETDVAMREGMLRRVAIHSRDDADLNGVLDRLPDPRSVEPYVGEASRISWSVMHNPAALPGTIERAKNIYEGATRGAESNTTQPATTLESPVAQQSAITRSATPIESAVSEKSPPVLDLNKKQTGWKRIEGRNNDSVTLVSFDGKHAVDFKSSNTKSGTASVRMNAEAQAFAIDNPYSGAPVPQGELITKPIYTEPSKPLQESGSNQTVTQEVPAQQPGAVAAPHANRETTYPLSETRQDSFEKWRLVEQGRAEPDANMRKLMDAVDASRKTGITTYDKSVDHVIESLKGYLPDNLSKGDGSVIKSEVIGAWHTLDMLANKKKNSDVKEQLGLKAGQKIGNITPNTGKMIRSASIEAISENDYTLVGTLGNKKVRITLDPTSLDRAIKRAQPEVEQASEETKLRTTEESSTPRGEQPSQEQQYETDPANQGRANGLYMGVRAGITRQLNALTAEAEAIKADKLMAKSERKAKLKEIRKQGDALKAKLNSGGITAVKNPDSKTSSLAAKVAKLFGREVVWVKGGAAVGFDGAYHTDAKGKSTVFLNVNSSKPAMVVLGHELLHAMKTENPTAYRALRKAILANVKAEGKEQQKEHAEAYAKYYDNAEMKSGELAEEFVADIVGNRFSEPEFWQQVFSQVKDRGFLKQIADFVIQYIDKILAQGSRDKVFGSDYLVRDLEAARSAIASYVAQHLENNGKVEQQAGKTETKFSKKRDASNPVANDNDAGIIKDAGGEQYGHGQTILAARLARLGIPGIDTDRGGRDSIVPEEWTRSTIYSDERGRADGSFAGREAAARAEQAKLIETAKAHGFFIDKESPFLDAVIAHENVGGVEHDAYIAGEANRRVVIRSTAKSGFGLTSPDSPAQYLKRMEDYNATFPLLQIRVVGVSQNLDGVPVIWTAQSFVPGEKYQNSDELAAAFSKKGWYAVPGATDRYQHKETGAVIDDAHVRNVLHIGDKLYPIDIVVKETPKTNTRIKLSNKRAWYFSPLERAIEGAPDKVFSKGSQVKVWLTANKAKLGLKDDELQWSGVLDYLELRGKDKVSKQEVVDYLQGNGVKVEDVVLGAGDTSMLKPYTVEQTGDGWNVLDHNQPAFPDGRVADGPFTEEWEATNRAEILNDDLADGEYTGWTGPSAHEPKFESYVPPGGKPGTYRETLVTLPSSTKLPRGWEIKHFPQADQYALYNERGEQVTRRPTREQLVEIASKSNGMNFKSSHFDQPNILVHLRTDEVEGADGKRYLRVIEVQSDWGQKGKKEGFTGRTTTEIEEELSSVNRERSRLLQEAADLPDSEMEKFKAMNIRIKELGEKATALDAEFQNSVGKTPIPSAPFVTDTKAWVSLGVKRAIQQAMYSGLDGVVFATGQQNADLYSLDKKIREVSYDPTLNGGTLIADAVGAGPASPPILDKSGIKPEQIADYIGKDASDKLLNNPTEMDGTTHTLRGDDLRVEATGMRAFYDQIVPQVTDKVLKQIGADTKVTGVTVDGGKQPGFPITDTMRDRASREGLPLFSTSRILGDSGRYTPEQRAAIERTGGVVTDKTIAERVGVLKQDMWKKIAQGMVDQFRPIRDLSDAAYTLSRLAKGATGAFEAFMQHGKLSLRDGAYDADTSGGVLQNVFIPLGKEATDFLRWIAGNRAEKLMAEGRENLFSKDDIKAFKSLATGDAPFEYTLANGQKTHKRELIYKDALVKFNEANKNILDMAEQSGLIDPASRKLWESEFYVPFYRAAEDGEDGFRGMNIKNGLIRQKAFEKLKGGTDKLNDLMENTLMNWAHLIDASAKNRAAKATLEAAAAPGVGAARKAIKGEKNTVWFMDNGKKKEYKVDDPYLLTAISSLEYSGLHNPMMDALSATKHWLTMGVTASPFFKVRNLIRDSVQAIATSDIGYNPLANIKKGFELTDREAQEYVSALAGGGLIRFGTMLEGSWSGRVRQLIKQGSKDAHILDGEGKIRAFYDKFLEPAVSAYNELGNRGEEINRMALYDKLISQGMDHAKASLMARDLMDFSMQGTWGTIRFLTQVVPFMNARLQGLYKLGRASAEDRQRLITVITGASLASLALLAWYGDDDDWKRREDWDRDNYWWFKLGGEVFKIPKPFEIGAVATLAERSAELLFDKEMTGERFRKAVLKLTTDQLSMNPVPQAFKPVIDLYANKDSFTQRPIEPMGMERLDPSHRYKNSTSLVARGISAAGNAVTGEHFASPVQIDFMVQSYFGWLGSFIVTGADLAARSVSNEPTRPTVDYWKTATGGMVQSLEGAHSRYVSQMYDQAKELEQAYATWNSLRKEGKVEEAIEYREQHRDELGRYRSVEAVKKQMAKLNERVKMIERSDRDPDEKRDMINRIRDQQDQVARRVAPGL